MEKKNYNAIDAARILAACYPVVNHAMNIGNPIMTGFPYELRFFFLQYLCRIFVPFFFVTSGFFFFRKTSPDSFDLAASGKGLRHYLRLYLLWSAIYFPLTVQGILTHPKGPLVAALGQIRSFVLVGTNIHLWYVNSLFFALLLISLLLSRGVKPARIMSAATVFYLIGMFGQTWFGALRPLREGAPGIWHALRLLGKLIVTTRNGLMFGFLLVGMGMVFAYYGVRVSRRTAVTGFLVSYACMGLEVYLFRYLGTTREYDMTLCLIPTLYFLFSILLTTELPDRPIYPVMRKLSALVYFIHMWVMWIIDRIAEGVGYPLAPSLLRTVLTLLGSVALSLLLIKLSEKSRSGWLKYLI